ITVPGSPIWALEDDTKGGFDRFFLFEKNERHFEVLIETLNDEFQLNFDVATVDIEGLDFKIAKSQDSIVKAFQVDSNVGAKLLAKE
ncbi:MAG: hypothetical protein ABEI86_09540, partial [Halobacteriaceae archaeon]